MCRVPAETLVETECSIVDGHTSRANMINSHTNGTSQPGPGLPARGLCLGAVCSARSPGRRSRLGSGPAALCVGRELLLHAGADAFAGQQTARGFASREPSASELARGLFERRKPLRRSPGLVGDSPTGTPRTSFGNTIHLLARTVVSHSVWRVAGYVFSAVAVRADGARRSRRFSVARTQ